MNVTKSEYKDRQPQNKGYMQKVSAEQKEYAEASAHKRITENNITNAYLSTDDLLEKILGKDNLNAAFKKVKSNKGAGGIDEMEVDELLPYLRENREQLIQTIRDGKYHPNPVRRVEIPKEEKGKVRKLGIPTVVDRVIQQAISQILSPIFETQFSEYSYGFRPKRSAHVKEKWIRLYISRWLKTSFVTVKGEIIERTSGTPQGGVISPVLANMFLHYVFDMWMARKYKSAPFERYADDAVIHCKTEQGALELKKALTERMKECGLELHPLKTRIVYCKDKDRIKTYPITEFDFLGYTFKEVYIKCRDGKIRNNFVASVSKKSCKSFRDKIKSLEIHKKTGCKINMIAEELNPTIRGWINYFGKFNASAMKYSLDCVDRRLIKWAMCKYKCFRGRRRFAENWLSQIKEREPVLFAHWKYRYGTMS